MRKVKSIAKVPFAAPDVVTKPVPVPTDGWDAISPLAAMDPKRAPILDNWVPRPGFVELRAGNEPWTLSLGNQTATPVETLIIYRGSISEQMFAACGASIYDVTTRGGSAAVVSGKSSARWQYESFRPAGGTMVLQLVNGADDLLQYDGTSWTNPSITGLPVGVTTANFINIHAQKRRLWYLVENSVIAVFMPTDAISGAVAGNVDLGASWTKGGHIVAMADWTIDGGSGPQDYAAFISSQGQVTLYSGTDPTSATTWSIVGTFDLAPPIGFRCTLKVGSDVAIITMQGVLPLSQALPFDPSADRSVAITSRIQNAMAQASQQARNNFGWQLVSFPDQQLAVLNVPLIETTSAVQFVMNALTGAWCRFTGWNANCFEIFNEDLYFGDSDSNVMLAYSGGLDMDQPIPADMQCAFNYFDDPGRTKRMTMVQPLMVASGNITPFISIDVDFGANTLASPITILQGGSLWDDAEWDVDVWSVPTTTITSWLSAQGLGHALAIRMKVNVSSAPLAVSPAALFDISRFDTATFDTGSGVGPAATLQVNAFNAIMEMGAFV